MSKPAKEFTRRPEMLSEKNGQTTGAQGGRPDTSSPVPRLDFTWIRPNLMIGNWIAASDSNFLDSQGIRSVLFLDEDAAPRVVDQLRNGRRVEVVGLFDGPGNDFVEFAKAVHRLSALVLQCPPVLVACYQGLSRSPAVVAAHLVQTEGLLPGEAAISILSARDVSIAPSLMELVARMWRGP